MAMVAGGALCTAQRTLRGPLQAAVMPAALLASVAAFGLARAWLGSAATTAWAMQVDGAAARVWPAVAPLLSLDSRSWMAALRGAVAAASVVALPTAIGRLLIYSSLEQASNVMF